MDRQRSDRDTEARPSVAGTVEMVAGGVEEGAAGAAGSEGEGEAGECGTGVLCLLSPLSISLLSLLCFPLPPHGACMMGHDDGRMWCGVTGESVPLLIITRVSRV